jgi:hypothetical protein
MVNSLLRYLKVSVIVLASTLVAIYLFDLLLATSFSREKSSAAKHVSKCEWPWPDKSGVELDTLLIDRGWRNANYVRKNENFKEILEDTLCLNNNMYQKNGEKFFKGRLRTETYVYNKQGYRGLDWDLAVGEKKKLFIIGASTAFSFLNDEKNTIDAYLNSEFKKLNIDIKIFNAAVPGIAPLQEYLILKDVMNNYRPDYILIINGFNSGNGVTSGYDQRKVLGTVNSFSSLLIKITKFLDKHSIFLNISSMLVDASEKLLIRDISSVEAFKLGTNLMRENCSDNAKKCFFVLQPTVLTTNKALTESEKKIKWLWFYNKKLTFADRFDGSYAIFKDHLSTFDPYFIDASNLAESSNYSSQEVFLDAAHLTPLGNKLLAEQVAKYMAARL